MACPECESSEHVQIAQGDPREPGRAPSWKASCAGCGHVWNFED